MRTVKCLIPAFCLMAGGVLAASDHTAAKVALSVLTAFALAYGVMRSSQ